MKSRFLIIVCFSLCVVFSLAIPMTALAQTAPAATAGQVLVESLTFPVSKLTLVKGASYTLAAAVSPDGAADKSVSYASSNTAVASVDLLKGEVTAKKAGTAVITAAAGDLSGMKASYTLTVVSGPALKVSLAKKSYKTGETVKMTAVITGTGYKNTKFYVQKNDGSGTSMVYEGTAKTGKTVYESWNTKNAEPGTYEVIAVIYGEDGAELQSAGSTFKVTVPVTGLKINNTKLSLEKGDTYQLTAEVSPPNANQAVSYQTSKSSVASVDQNGLITAKKAGTATITIVAKDGGKKVTCTVTVSQYKYNVNKLVGAAVKYLGTIEDPLDSNLIFFNDWYFGKTGMAVPWCGVFVTKVIYDAGMIGTTWGSLNTARKSVAEGVRNYRTLAKRQKRWITSGYKRGDIVLFDWQSNGGYDHIAIIESVSESGKTITTIEGNTSDPEGIQIGDVGVYRKTRSVDGQVLGAYRPPYEK
jgi:uncharacterized protein YjdB